MRRSLLSWANATVVSARPSRPTPSLTGSFMPVSFSDDARSLGACVRCVNANHALAEILAAIQAGDRIGRRAQPVEDLFAIAQPALAHPCGETRHRLLRAVLVLP